jgi:hypothetical protein
VDDVITEYIKKVEQANKEHASTIVDASKRLAEAYGTALREHSATVQVATQRHVEEVTSASMAWLMAAEAKMAAFQGKPYPPPDDQPEQVTNGHVHSENRKVHVKHVDSGDVEFTDASMVAVVTESEQPRGEPSESPESPG